MMMAIISHDDASREFISWQASEFTFDQRAQSMPISRAHAVSAPATCAISRRARARPALPQEVSTLYHDGACLGRTTIYACLRAALIDFVTVDEMPSTGIEPAPRRQSPDYTGRFSYGRLMAAAAAAARQLKKSFLSMGFFRLNARAYHHADDFTRSEGGDVELTKASRAPMISRRKAAKMGRDARKLRGLRDARHSSHADGAARHVRDGAISLHYIYISAISREAASARQAPMMPCRLRRNAAPIAMPLRWRHFGLAQERARAPRCHDISVLWPARHAYDI